MFRPAEKTRMRFNVVLILTIISAYLTAVQSHVCMLVERPDHSRGGILRWSLPYNEVCICQGVVAPRSLSGKTCPAKDEYDDGELWFIDDPRPLTKGSNWQKDILDNLMQRTQYCANECALNTDNCDTHAVCTNIPGSFTCTCDTGYLGDGVTCADIDECVIGNHSCDVNAACSNTAGSYTCLCYAGYIGDGISCDDIDECAALRHNCDDLNGICSNIGGGFSCACAVGYSGDGISCTDFDECATGDHNCDINGICSNNIGSFTCACAVGYSGDGISCTDIDECATGDHNCDINGICSNNNGTFTCACAVGYSGDGISCTDIDECATGDHNCDINGICSNNYGSFTCACAAGYSGNGISCNDINECAIGDHNCDDNGICSNINGSFTCACAVGYRGDGISCTVCRKPLGMKSREIRNNQITESKMGFGDGENPGNARLNNNGRWRDTLVNSPWLMVSFDDKVQLSGIIIQGWSSWVTECRFEMENYNSDKNYTANSDGNTPVTILFDAPVETSYIKVIPTECRNGWCPMRLEILGTCWE